MSVAFISIICLVLIFASCCDYALSESKPYIAKDHHDHENDYHKHDHENDHHKHDENDHHNNYPPLFTNTQSQLCQSINVLYAANLTSSGLCNKCLTSTYNISTSMPNCVFCASDERCHSLDDIANQICAGGFIYDNEAACPIAGHEQDIAHIFHSLMWLVIVMPILGCLICIGCVLFCGWACCGWFKEKRNYLHVPQFDESERFLPVNGGTMSGGAIQMQPMGSVVFPRGYSQSPNSQPIAYYSSNPVQINGMVSPQYAYPSQAFNGNNQNIQPHSVVNV